MEAASQAVGDRKNHIIEFMRILGSAAYSLCTVARGSALLAFEATPKIWDIAAGWLLVEEAGGLMESLSGKAPIPPVGHEDYNKINFPTLAAPRSIVSRRTQGS